MAGVILAGVSRVYPRGTVALDQLDLEVRDGEFLVLVGPSGSGKTTTLRLIAGLEKVTAGQIRIGQRVVNKLSPRERDVALVPESQTLFPHFDVRGNLAFGLREREQGNCLRRAWQRLVRPRQAAEAAGDLDRRVRAAAEMLGIDGLLDRKPETLSGGEQQRVALGRAWLRRPQVCLLDEPLAHLDPPLRLELRRELKRLHRKVGMTTIHVTHDAREAMALGDRVAVLRGGRLQQVGPVREVYEQPANRFVAGLLGTPPMNFVEGVLSAEPAGEWFFRAAGWSVAVDSTHAQALQRYLGSRLVLGLRPDGVQITDPNATAPAAMQAVNGWQAVSGRVESAEYEGDATIVCLALGTGTVVVEMMTGKAEVTSDWQPGQPVKVWLDMRRVRWFDPATGQSIASAG